MLTQFNESAQKAIVMGESIAFDLGHSHVGSEHLLLSIMRSEESELSKFLLKYQMDQKAVSDDIERLFGKSDTQPFYMEYSEVTKKVLEEALRLAKDKQCHEASLNDLTMALISQKESVAVELMNKYHVDFDKLIEFLKEEECYNKELDYIDELVNVNKKVKQQEYLVIGREQELQQVSSILCKKEKNNVLIIGEAGVGKSALVEKLAQLINAHQVVPPLKNKVIYELSLSSLVAGTKYRGEFEEKLKKILAKVIASKNVILFIDEIHNLIGAGGAEGAIDASNILKPYLARKEITVIGATTLEEYYKYFEKDQAMNRRFALVKMQENTKEETLSILQGLKEKYMSFHNIFIDDYLLEDIITYSDRYMTQLFFPDKALDLLDLSCVECLFEKEKELTLKHIQTVIENQYGFVLEHSLYDSSLLHSIQEVIKGQKKPLQTLINSIAFHAHFNKDKPQGIFLLLGKSGVGKTETVKQLSILLHRPLIQLDMGEYSEEYSVSKIIGAPQGYIGYNDSNPLFKELVLHPHSILLLDEIEKANDKVLHLFLSAFESGIVKDSLGRKMNFKETLIIMTSNALMNDSSQVGFKKQNYSTHKLNKYFPIEFLSRIDEIITFNTLTTKDYQDIIKSLNSSIDQQSINDIIDHHNQELGAREIIKEAQKYMYCKSNG